MRDASEAREYSPSRELPTRCARKITSVGLHAYRNQVEAQTGKAFTAAEAAILADLSRERLGARRPDALLRELDGSRLADHRHFDLTRILELVLDLPGDLV